MECPHIVSSNDNDIVSCNVKPSLAKTDDDAPEIQVTEDELKLNFLDYYPAEMCHWRSLEPYTIKSKLTCNINYDSKDMIRRPETIYLDVCCKVVKPDFITNLKQQRIDFGGVAIGMNATVNIIIQNIKYGRVKPKISVLNPVGQFSVSYVKDCEIPPEHYLKLPVKFEPRHNMKVNHFSIF